MATGDISNNIRKLQSKLKAIKYTEELDVNLLAEGQPKPYLPIYHYAFTNYSPSIARLIFDEGIDVYGKSDSRFMEAVYKILRDMFTYKPPITKEQFFAKGFAERKIIMCTEILQLVKKKHTELNPAPAKTTLKTGVRPKSAPDTKHLPLAVPKTKGPNKSQPVRSFDQDPHRIGTKRAPQVVNELRSPPSSDPVRHLSTSASHLHPVRHIAANETLDSARAFDQSESIPSKPPSILSQHAAMLRKESQPVKHVSIQSPRQVDQTPPKPEVSSSVWAFDNTPDIEPVETRFITSRIKEVACLPKDWEEDTSIVEIQAQTSDTLLMAPAPTSSIDLSSLYQTVEVLTSQVRQLVQNKQAAGNSVADEKIDEVLSKIENLTARILLLENRVSIIEAKMGDIPVLTSVPDSKPNRSTYSVSQVNSQVLPAQNHCETDTALGISRPDFRQGDINDDIPGLFVGPGNSFAEELKTLSGIQKSILKGNSDFSLNYSPIRLVKNGLTGITVSANEDTFVQETGGDAQRASTPTSGTLPEESSFQCDISHMETKDAVARIKNMIKETTQMMKDNSGAESGS